MKISHIGIAVNSIVESAKFYVEGLNLEKLEEEIVAEQQVKVLKLDINSVHIELLEPLTPNEGPIGKFIEKNNGKGGIHHIAYEVHNIEEIIQKLRGQGYKTLTDEPRIGAGGAKIIFLHPKDTNGVLTELCQH